MFCKNCGKEINEGTKFCPNCGQECSAMADVTKAAKICSMQQKNR